MSKQYDAAVIGTGVIGLATARALLDRGLTVAVIGPRAGEHPGQATRAAGAMLSTFSEIEPGHDTERARTETAERLAAHGMYPEWLAGLGVDAPAGTWVLAPAGRQAWLRPIADAACAAGHPAEQHDARDIPGLEAPAESAAALWLPTEARIDSHALLDALTTLITRHPAAEWPETTAAAVSPGLVSCTDGTTISAGHVILAAGAAIPQLLPGPGRSAGVPPVLAGRGVSLLLRARVPAVPHVVRTPNAAFACGVHLVPRSGELLYLGGTNRLTLNPDPGRSPDGSELASLISDATAMLDSRLGDAEIVAARMGLRPYTVDHLPLVGRTAGDPSLLLATGTYRCGVLLAPRLAQLIADEITSPGTLDQHPYRASRPVAIPAAEATVARAAGDILDHVLRDGGHLAPQSAAELSGFLTAAFRALLGEPGQRQDTPLRRLWEAAPVPEVIPSVMALAARLESAR